MVCCGWEVVHCGRRCAVGGVALWGAVRRGRCCVVGGRALCRRRCAVQGIAPVAVTAACTPPAAPDAHVNMCAADYTHALAQVLAVGHALTAAAVRLRLLQPAAHPGWRALSTSMLLNAASLAVACCAYYSYCGNGLAATASGDGGDVHSVIKRQTCSKWLHPLPALQYPRFATWMIYGALLLGGVEFAGRCWVCWAVLGLLGGVGPWHVAAFWGAVCWLAWSW